MAVNILPKKVREYMIQAMRVLNFRERILPDGIPRKICAWCKTVISEGEYPVTHGICPACVEKEMRRYLGGIGIHEEGSRRTGFF